MPSAWKPHLETGIFDIDAQHKKLFDAVGALSAALATPGEVEATHAAHTLEWLTGYALEHFEAEERWMRENRFPHRREHIAKHDEFLTRVAAMTKDLREEGVASAVLKLRLRNALAWLETHVEDEDRELGKHLRATTRRVAAASAW